MEDTILVQKSDMHDTSISTLARIHPSHLEQVMTPHLIIFRLAYEVIYCIAFEPSARESMPFARIHLCEFVFPPNRMYGLTTVTFFRLVSSLMTVYVCLSRRIR